MKLKQMIYIANNEVIMPELKTIKCIDAMKTEFVYLCNCIGAINKIPTKTIDCIDAIMVCTH